MAPYGTSASKLAGLLALVVGLVVGTAFGRLTDTGYTETELKNAVAQARTQARVDSETTTQRLQQEAAAEVEAAQGDTQDLAAQNQRLERSIGQRDRTIGRLDAEIRSLTKEVHALDEPEASVIEAPPQTAPSASELRVSGTLKSSWVLSSQLKPWPPDCSGAQKSYQVRVDNGSGITVSIAEFTQGRIASRNEKNGILTLTCLLTYDTVLPQPLSAVYKFVALSKSDANAPLKTALVPVASLHDGSGPELYVSFCPEC